MYIDCLLIVLDVKAKCFVFSFNERFTNFICPYFLSILYISVNMKFRGKRQRNPLGRAQYGS